MSLTLSVVGLAIGFIVGNLLGYLFVKHKMNNGKSPLFFTAKKVENYEIEEMFREEENK